MFTTVHGGKGRVCMLAIAGMAGSYKCEYLSALHAGKGRVYMFAVAAMGSIYSGVGHLCPSTRLADGKVRPSWPHLEGVYCVSS